MNNFSAKNKKANFEYDIIDKYEAGIVLEGWEVKSIKDARFSFEGSFVTVIKEEAFLRNFKIVPLKYSPEVTDLKKNRDKKLLLNKREILKILLEVKKSGMTIIPLEIYSNPKGKLKVIIALVKGKKKFDKRSKLKERDMKRNIELDRKMLNR